MKANTDYVFGRELKDGRPYLTKQQYNTIKGQAKKAMSWMQEKVCKKFYTERTGDKMYTLKEMIHKFKFYKKLNMLTANQFQILRKQAVSGDIDGAERQFQKMIGRVKLYD